MSRAGYALLLLLSGAAAGCHRGVPPAVAPRPPGPPPAEAPADLSLPLRYAALPNGLHVIVAEMPARVGATVALVCGRGGDAGIAARPGLAAATRQVLSQLIVDRVATTPGQAGRLVVSLDHRGPGRAAEFVVHMTTGDVAPMLWGFASALRRFEVRADALARVRPAAPGAPAPTPADVEGHFRASYSPASCAVVAAGALTHGAVMAYVEPLLGPWSNPTTPPAAGPAVPPPAGGRFVLEAQPWRAQTRVTVTFPLRVAGARELAAFRVACGLLSPWNSSRLLRVLRHERGDVYHLEGGCHVTGEAGEIRVEGELAPDRAPAAVRVIHDVAEALASGAARVTAAEVDRVRRQTLTAWRASVDSEEAVVTMAVEALEEGRAPDGAAPAWIDALRTVTPAEVDAFLQRELSTARARVEVVGPPGATLPGSFEGTGFSSPGRD